ncbi:hypothetical protein [Kineococcus sp. SYSU DK002]|uniref:hypothetical protein n=1 Tax=Kineococcus sp. SYSU DK002 TaxID=3383123 RepID=UPI003D7CCEDA
MDSGSRRRSWVAVADVVVSLALLVVAAVAVTESRHGTAALAALLAVAWSAGVVARLRHRARPAPAPAPTAPATP